MITRSALRRLASLLPLALTLAPAACTLAGGGSGDDVRDGAASPAPSGGDDGPGTDAPGPGGDPGGDPGPGPGGARRVIGYYAAWDIYARGFLVTDIDAGRLTHINYAFANLSDGACALGDSWADVEKPMGDDTWDTPLRGNFHRLQVLKQEHPGLKTLISVGGWTWSGGFSAAASTAAGREKLATSCVKFMKDYGFDGIDIDWEYPVSGGLSAGSPADKENYTLLLKALRDALDAQGAEDGGAHYLLSIAAPAGPSTIANLEVEAIHEHLDHINVMTYDFHGAWESVTNFNAPLYPAPGDPSPGGAATTLNVDAAVQAYLAHGVPSDKLVVGMPFYGRAWQGVPATNDGLFQPASGAAPGPYEAGILDFQDVAPLLSTYTRHFSAEAEVPWLYNPQTGIMISYDDAESIARKAEYVNEHALGGAMVWELSGDDDQGTLLSAIHDTLAP